MEENEIKIGDQTWTTQNLDVSTYRNGDAIPQVEDEEEWANLTTGAWCYYENESGNGTTYGKIYNYYAVTDPRGLAPKGYHIPTDKEWTILTDHLGGGGSESKAKACKKMKSKNGWAENGNGNNISGFNALPGGERNRRHFGLVSQNGGWWSSSESRPDYAWCRILSCFDDNLSRLDNRKLYGYSVRCLRD